MPLTPEQKRRFIESKGVDPNKWDLDETPDDYGNLRWKPITDVQPSGINAPEVTPISSPITTSKSEAFFKHGAAAAFPTAAGIAGGIGIPAIIGSMFGPLGTVAGIGTGIGGGLLSGLGAARLQDKFIPEETKQRLALLQAEHPTASLLGGFAPVAIPFSPVQGIRNIPEVVRSAKDLITYGRSALTARQSNLLLNTGVNVGTQAGVETAQQLTDEQPGIDWKRLALSTALGGILSEPSKFGRRLGITGSADIPDHSQPLLAGIRKNATDVLEREKLVQSELDLKEASKLRVENERRAQDLINPEQDVLLTSKAKTIPDDKTRLESLKYRYQESPATPEESPLLRANPKYAQEYRKLAERRGIFQQEVPQVTKPTGEEVLGEAREDLRATKISVEKAALDTPPHETGHIWISDLAQSPVLKDRRLVQRGLQIAGGEEALAKQLGLRGYGRTKQDIKGNEKFKQWWKDFTTHFKTKFRLASDDDVLEFLTQRMYKDAPYGSRPEFLPPDINVGAAGAKTSFQDYSDLEIKPEDVLNATSESFVGMFKGRRMTEDAYKLGEKLKGNPDEIARMEEYEELARKEFRMKMEQGRFDEAITLSTKPQFFREAIEYAKNVKSGKHFQEDSDLFKTDTEKELGKPRPFGLTLDKHGNLPAHTFWGQMQKRIPKDELIALQEAGFEAHKPGEENKPVNIKERLEWLRENGPKLEVKKLDAHATIEIDTDITRLTELRHNWFDLLDQHIKDNVNNYASEYRKDPESADTLSWRNQTISEIPDTIPSLRRRFIDNMEEFAKLQKKSLDAWTEVDTGLNDSATANYQMVNPKPLKDMPGAVDILVRVPTEKVTKGSHPRSIPMTTYYPPKFQGHHFGESDKNIVGWTRGYMETLEDGKKVFHVFELQSDWAQSVKDKIERVEQTAARVGRYEGADIDAVRKSRIPELNYYEHLALKAAIKYAHEQGADFIAISDAETAMLTEGHDRQAYNEAVHSDDKKINIKQEPGMRIHYDEIIPNILRKLTGQEGQKVSFGEHQNIKDTQHDNVGGIVRTGLRKNLIFKNSDGTPKTDITARMFPLSGIGKRIDAGEPFSIYGSKYQESSSLLAGDESAPDVKEERYGFIKSWEAANDKVRRIDPKVGAALDNYASDKDRLMATLRNVPLRDIRQRNLSEEEMENAYLYMRGKFRNEKDLPDLSESEQSLVEEILQPVWKRVREIQNEAGLKVYNQYGVPHTGKVSEYYAPDMLSDEALELFTRRAYTPEAKSEMRNWAEYVVENSDGRVKFNDALDHVQKYVEALGGSKLYQIEFNALRKAQGYGVPESLRESNLLKIVGKYGRRASQDLAYWRQLQSNPYVAAALKLPKPDGGISSDEKVTVITQHPDVKNALKFVFNDFTSITNPRITAATRAVSNAILGGATGVRDLVATIANTSPYIKNDKDIIAFFRSLSDFSNNAEGALRTGARSETMDFDRWMSLENPDKITEVLNKFAEAFRKYQGRDLLEQTSRIVTFGFGRELAKLRAAQSLQGDEAAGEFLQKFGTLVENPPDKYTPEDIDQIAKNFTDRVQGTYDARGLASGTFEGPLAPFIALSRWSIEKSNVIYKDVVKPMQQGDYRPFLTYTLGTILTGAAISELNELMSGKKAPTVTLKEAISEDSKEHMVSSVIALMQLGGYAGIISDMARMASDAVIEHEKPRGLSFPLVDFATETIGEGLQDVFAALDAGSNPVDVIQDFTLEIIRSSIQNARLINSRILDTGNAERQNRFRDVRAFKKTQDEEVPSVASLRSASRFGSGELREFKRTKDISKAAEILPNLLSKALEKAKGDPYKLKQELSKLKANSYQTMPNPENMPISFVRYVQFLERTQGSEAASERMREFFEMNSLNKVKSEMVP